MIRYILFDIDDTLLNFRDTVDTVISRALADVGLSFTAEQFAEYHRINGGLWEQVSAGKLDCNRLYEIRFQRVLDALGLPADGTVVEARFRHHLKFIAQPEEGAAETLAALSERYVLATASNAPQKQQEQRLEIGGLAPYFKHILTSGGLGYDKPSSAFYNACLRVLGDPPRDEVLMVGDSLSADVRGALNAGIKACWLNTRRLPVPDDLTVPVVYSLPALGTLLL